MHDPIGHLRALRLKARPGISLRAFAAELEDGLTPTAVSSIERGLRDAVSIAQVADLAQALGVSPQLVLRRLLEDRPHLMNGRPGKKKRLPKVARRSGRVKKNNGRRR